MPPIARATCRVLFAGLLSTGSVNAFAALQQPAFTYEQFMQLSAEQRRDRLASLPAEDQAVLKRTHARRWLDANRDSLSQAQIDLVTEAMSLLSGDRDRRVPGELQRRLTCQLGRARVTAAFTFLDVPKQRSWIDAADEWLAWFPDGARRGGR